MRTALTCCGFPVFRSCTGTVAARMRAPRAHARRLARRLLVNSRRVARDGAVAVDGIGHLDAVFRVFDRVVDVDDHAGAIAIAAPAELVLDVVFERVTADLVARVGDQLDRRGIPALVYRLDQGQSLPAQKPADE